MTRLSPPCKQKNSSHIALDVSITLFLVFYEILASEDSSSFPTDCPLEAIISQILLLFKYADLPFLNASACYADSQKKYLQTRTGYLKKSNYDDDGCPRLCGVHDNLLALHALPLNKRCSDDRE
jgi:hypothetical protein